MVGRRLGRRWPVGLLVVLLAIPAVLPSVASPAMPTARVAAVPPGPCGLDLGPAAPTGTATVEGGPLGPDALVGATLVYSFRLVLTISDRASGVVLSQSCVGSSVNTTVLANGTYAFAPVVPPSECPPGSGVCVSFAGPYAPYRLRLSAPPPPGYSTSIGRVANGYAVAFVCDLAAISLAPNGSVRTIAPGAPTAFAAEGWTGNGSVTPLDPEYNWSMEGTGWSFASPPSGPDATVVAYPGAGIGRLEVAASALVENVTLAPPPVTVTLVAQPTDIEAASLGPTTVDVGTPVAVQIDGVGAPGYPYAATIDPGLGLADVTATCTTNSTASWIANVSCGAELTYPEPGLAQPTARLTNGYSTADWLFPEVTVNRAPELYVAPAAPVGYAGLPLAIEVAAASGSGTSPYASACLAVTGRSTICTTAPGPTWQFLPTFPAPGEYAARAWAIDADGSNASLSFSISVVPPLAAGPIGVTTGNLSAGVAISLNVSVAGGELPLRYWWNVSDVSGSVLAGATETDGTLTAAFVAPAPAAVTVSFTVVDALGTLVEVERVMTIGPVTALVVATREPPPSGSVVAGRSFDVAWQAVDRAGRLVQSFGATATLALGGPAAAVGGSVNVSGVGPLAALGGGEYGVPAYAWVGGVLNVSVSVTTAGVLTLALAGSALPSVPPTLEAVIAPDLDHLRLFDPVVARAGDRANATFWHVSDRYGNPAPGAPVTLLLRGDGGSSTTVVAAEPIASNGSGVWVNYSAPGPGAANLTVLDAAGQRLLGPIAIPPAAAPARVSPATVTLAAAVPIGALGAAWLGIGRRHARRRAARHSEEDGLRRLAEGRAHAVEIVRRAGPLALAEIEAAWRPAPAPAELADWLAALVTDGTLGATLGSDGRARFCLAAERGAGPRVTVDADTLDRAIRQREEILGDDGER